MKQLIAKITLTLTLAFNVTVGTITQMPGHTVATVAGITALSTLPVTTGFVGCSQDQLVASAKDVLDVLKSSSVQNALSTLAPGVLGEVLAAVPTAERLVELIRNSDFTNATAIINSLFPLIDEIADAVKASPKVLAFVALANIALHFIINHVKASAPASMIVQNQQMQRAIELGDKPVWGCNLRKDKRCAEMAK